MEEKVEWTWKVEIETRKKFPAVGEACMVIFRPTPGLKGEQLSAVGFQLRGP